MLGGNEMNDYTSSASLRKRSYTISNVLWYEGNFLCDGRTKTNYQRIFGCNTDLYGLLPLGPRLALPYTLRVWTEMHSERVRT